MSTTVVGEPKALTAEEFAERMLGSVLGFMEVFGVYLGDRLGWYAALRAQGPMTSTELAAATGTHERYAREWLEQQAVSGILLAEGADAWGRRFTLPEAVAEVLTDESSLAFMAPAGRMLVAACANPSALLDAYRTGAGVSWEQLGLAAGEAQAAMNRPWFEQRLPAALQGTPHLDRALSGRGARVAEVGFGGGWASISIARTYPGLRVDGFEVDAASVEMATRNAEAAGVTDRVSFHLVGGAEIGEQAAYDAVFAFECVHDMPHPVEVLAAMRRAARPGAPVVVMDEAVKETFTAPGDELERMMYGFSLAVCLPDGMSSPGSSGTGTVMRPSVLEGFARRAGYDHLDVLPIEDFGFFRFYQLHQ